jgi:hypothetical protein
MSPTFHDRLVSLYLDEVTDLHLPEDHRIQVRDRLVKFLEETDQYYPERVLAKLSHSTTIPEDYLTRRRGILARKGGGTQ